MSNGGGLEDVVATTSAICDLDGKAGVLRYYGIDIHELVKYSTFEETVYLLWHGKLPTQSQLDSLKQQLAENRAVDRHIIAMMHDFPRRASPMEVLRTAVSALAMYDPEYGDNSREANLRKAIRLTAKIPTIVASEERIRNGKDVLAPRTDCGQAANFLYMFKGEMPDEYSARVMDIAFILHADHELNASTFAARVTAATLANMYAAITSAIGALSGPLHGGANEQVMRMLIEIDDPSRAADFVHAKLERHEKVMGFGHRVYRTEDPRATHLRRLSRELGERTGNMKWFNISQAVEKYMNEERHINANVDFYSASVYYYLGWPIDLFTPIFACSRIAGWTAHVLEQYEHNRLIRPRAEYTGPRDVHYVPIDQRRE